MAWGTESEDKKSLLEKKLEERSAIDAIHKQEFSFEDALTDESEMKIIVSVYGNKNDSKTATAYGILDEGDSVFVLSFDHKSKRPTILPFIKNRDIKITVADAVKFYDKSDKVMMGETAEVTKNYTEFLIKEAGEKLSPDWIMIDGTDEMNSILEQVMRKNNGIGAYQGIANFGVWKERKQYIDDIHNKAISVAKKGVIYTMYTDKDEVIKDGAVIKKKDIPKWIGSVMRETDVVIRVDTTFTGGKRKFIACIESSKIPDLYPEGEYDITGKCLVDVLTMVRD